MSSIRLDTAPLTYGQLSVWRDIEHLPIERRHEPNFASYIDLPRPVPITDVGRMFAAIDHEHPGMRTIVDASDALNPRQILLDPCQTVNVAIVEESTDTLDRLRAIPFDVTSERPWRVLAVRDDDSQHHAQRLVFVQHHLGFDAAATELLHTAALTKIDSIPPPTPSPTPSRSLLDVAHEQRTTPLWSRRAEAVVRHFARVYAEPAAALADTHRNSGERHEPLIHTLTSTRMPDALHGHAARSGTSLASVLTAATLLAGWDLLDGSHAVVNLMASNRYTPEWSGLITSLNQWIPIAVTERADGLETMSRTVHARTLAAYRLAMYNIDSVSSGLDRPHDPTVAVNVVELPRLPAGYVDVDTTGHIETEPVFCAVGPSSYLRVLVAPEGVQLILRTRDLSAATAAEMLRGIHRITTRTSGRIAEETPA